eukprot:PhF_6_TR27844/c0_g2_i2/m.40645
MGQTVTIRGVPSNIPMRSHADMLINAEMMIVPTYTPGTLNANIVGDAGNMVVHIVTPVGSVRDAEIPVVGVYTLATWSAGPVRDAEDLVVLINIPSRVGTVIDAENHIVRIYIPPLVNLAPMMYQYQVVALHTKIKIHLNYGNIILRTRLAKRSRFFAMSSM